MLLLITGASGAGKSSARTAVASALAEQVETAELCDLSPVCSAAAMTLVWRQQTAELAVRRAVELQAAGRHLLLAGDPVPAIEIVAAPSSAQLEAIAVCLLDADAETQAARLAERGDHPALLADHQAFAGWMRRQATDPLHMPHVVSAAGWEEMRWDRLNRMSEGWEMRVIDTSRLSKPEVAEMTLAWCRQALAGVAPTLHVQGS